MQTAKKLQLRFKSVGDECKKTWWENYLKHGSCFWGLSFAQVEQEFKLWYQKNKLATHSHEQLLQLALHLFAQKHTEEKLAAILLLEKHVCLHLPWTKLLVSFRVLWERKLIHDWYVCDAFCLRVLRKLLLKHGTVCARRLVSQCRAPYVWQARSAVVPFVGNAEDYQDLVFSACWHLIRSEERFAKTAVGWLLRELSRTSPLIVVQFLNRRRKYLTAEVIDNALKYFPDFDKKLHKQALRMK